MLSRTTNAVITVSATASVVTARVTSRIRHCGTGGPTREALETVAGYKAGTMMSESGFHAGRTSRP
jgi:hypothetical protein